MKKTMLCIVAVFSIMFIQHFSISAAEDKTLYFATTQDIPLFNDRIMSIAAKKLGYNFSVTCMGMSSALSVSSTGERDGLLQSDGIDVDYPNFIKIPVSISNIDFVAIASKNFDKELSSWNDLTGLRVGYQHQREVIERSIPHDKVASITKRNTQSELHEELINGSIDVAVYPVITGVVLYMPEDLTRVGVLARSQIFPYINNRYAELAPLFEDCLNEMKQYGTFEKLREGHSLVESGKNAILHISSFYPDMNWESALQRGISSVINLYEDTSIYTIRLNSQLFRDSIGIVNSAHDVIRAAFISENPDVIIVSDNEALEFLRESYNILFPGVPIVACSVNSYSEDTYYGISENIINIKEDISAADTINEILELYPNTQNIFILNDYTSSGRAWYADILPQLEEFKDRVDFVHNDDIPFSDILDIADSFGTDTIILKGFYFIDSGKDYFTEREIQRDLSLVSEAPIFGLIESQVGFSMLGGKCIDAEVHGKTSAEVSMSIINGKTAESISAIDNIENSWIFDYSVMQNFGIKEGGLPNGSIIINKPLTLYEARPWIVISSIVFICMAIISVLILLHLYNRLKRRNNQLESVKSELGIELANELLQKDSMISDIRGRLEKAIDIAPTAFAISVDGKIEYSNEYCRNTLGIQVGNSSIDFFANVYDKEYIVSNVTRNREISKTLRFKTVSGNTHRFNAKFMEIDYEGKTGIAVWAVDVEEEENRRYAHDEILNVLNSLPVATIIIDVEQKNIAYANQSFFSIFKVGSISMTGRANVFKVAKEYNDTKAEGSTFASWKSEYVLRDGSTISATVFCDEVIYNSKRSLIFVFIS